MNDDCLEVVLRWSAALSGVGHGTAIDCFAMEGLMRELACRFARYCEMQSRHLIDYSNFSPIN